MKKAPDWLHIDTIQLSLPKRTIMVQTAFTIRMDTDIKKIFDELCKEFGMSANTAFNIFARAFIKQERIPFDVESKNQAKLQRA